MRKYIKSFVKYFMLFCCGGMTYMTIEMVYRGYSDYTMAVLGGMAFVFIGCINNFIPWEMSLVNQCLIGGILIVTPLEYLFGVLFNQAYTIWDYRNVPLNIDGQICLPFSLIWCLLSIVAIVIDDYIRYYAFDEEKPIYKII